MVSQEIVGTLGHTVAIFSHEYFGYLSYCYLLGLIYTLYLLIRIKKPTEQFWIQFFISVFVFVNLLLLQALVFDGEMAGVVGEVLVSLLTPIIGSAGIWIFVFIGSVVGCIMLMTYRDFDWHEIGEKIKKTAIIP